MPIIYKYQKISDAYTTYLLAEPDYELLGLEDRITELCTIDGVTYVSVPDAGRKGFERHRGCEGTGGSGP